MYLLAIDTSTNLLSITLFKNRQVVQSVNHVSQMQHGVLLVPKIEELLQEAGILSKEIQAIAVGVGPGSYTGMRIGITLAKIWGMSLNIPVFPLSSLALIAATAEVGSDVALIIPIMDARRGTAYIAGYQYNQEGQLQVVSADTHMDWQAWVAEHEEMLNDSQQIVLVGDKIATFVESLRELQPNLEIVHYDNVEHLPNTVHTYKVIDEAVEDLTLLMPNYVQLTLAEREWLEKTERVISDEALVDTTIQ